MDLTPNRLLGHYRLIEKIGEGGMGVVWRAADTTLGREVAIKFLPDLFAEDPDRLARFEREAKVLASLNHPGIATIHGLHHAEGMHFLAMELAPGIDLATRLAAGPVPMDEAIGIALKVTEALEAAHDHGIVHRDLKPANIQIAPDGRIKILDFGLAKAFDAEPGGALSTSASLSPTLTTPAATRAGLILGTAAYMSPEQAKGKPVDRRADIWAFGCVLYEMLGGKRAFQGDGVSELIAAVIMAPVDFESLPKSLPGRVRLLVRRCMEKDPRRRLRDIGEARILLEETLAGAPDPAAPAAVPAAAAGSRRRAAFAAAFGAAVAAALAAVGAWSLRPAPTAAEVRRFEIPTQGAARSPQTVARVAAISPDGKAVAYVEGGALLVRRLARLEPIAIKTPAEPGAIFWSPDGAWLGYVAAGKLYKVPAGGGESSLIADMKTPLSGGSGASWCPDGHIVLSTGDGPILRVSSLGGDLAPYVPLVAGQEGDLHDPECLPDNSVIFAPHLQGGRPSVLVLFAGGQRKELLRLPPDQDIWFPVYSPTGHILYRRQPTNVGVWALPFSLARHEATGPPFLVAPSGDVPSVSHDGTLLYGSGALSLQTQMVWVDRTGKEIGPIGPEEEQWPFPEISPDGRHVAISARENDVEDVWISDVERNTRTRMSAGVVTYSAQAWSPDGRTLIFGEGVSAPPALKRRASDGSGEAITMGPGWSPAYSADGRTIVYADVGKDTFWDLWSRPADGTSKPVPFYVVPGTQIWPRLSPDGRFIAYVSDEGGSYDIYVKRFPSGEGKWQVSSGRGMWPRWGKSGRRLYYVNRDDLMEVDVATAPDLHLGAPRRLFTRPSIRRALIFGWDPGYDVTADEQRFVFCRPVGKEEKNTGMIVVQNWASEFAAGK
jgi:hypothetical protein